MREWMLRLPPAQAALAGAISNVCEVAQCAGWLRETEFVVWQLLHDPLPAWGLAGPVELAPRLEAVAAAAKEAGCWVVWPDDAEYAHAVGMAEWEERYGRWRDGR